MPSETKVLFLNHVNAVGGAEKSLFDLISGLDRKRFKPLLGGPADGRLAAAAQAAGITYVPLPLCRLSRSLRPDKLLRTFLGLQRGTAALRDYLLQGRDISIVHANNDTAMIFAERAARSLPAVRLVWHCRDLVNLSFLGTRLYRRAGAVITISATVRRHIQQYADYPPTKLHTIANGMNFNTLIEQGTRKFTRGEFGVLSDHVVVVGMVGQFVPWKRHDLFLQAAAIIAARKPNTFFVIVGEDIFNDHPGYRAHLQALAEKPPLAGKVLFTGYRSDMTPMLEAMDVVVHPTANEPFGRVLVEALALRKPVVAIDAAGPSEIITHGQDGILVPAGDVPRLAEAVLNLADNPELGSRLGSAGGMQVRRRYNLAEYVRQIEAVYANLAAT